MIRFNIVEFQSLCTCMLKTMVRLMYDLFLSSLDIKRTLIPTLE